MTGVRKEKCIGLQWMDRNSCYKTTGVHPSFQMKLNHAVDRDLMIEGQNEVF